MKPIAIIITIALCFMNLHHAKAQIPSSCFEIESILADACGLSSNEAANEMVRFVVGPTPVSLSTMNVQWPNTGSNPFLGICYSGTSAKVAIMNAGITSCGHILEPVGGILPAGAKVIFVTSTDMDPYAHSFANLTDTVYMIFQCAGNTTPHFRNYAVGVGSRTLSMQFATCSESVTYFPDQLVTPAGLPGAADGALANFDWSGAVSYANYNCQAPFNTLTAILTVDDPLPCAGDLLNLTATISNNNYTSFFWTAGAGVIGNPSTLMTNYQTSGSFTGIDHLQFAIVDNCGDTIYTGIDITINSGNNVAIVASGSTTFCEGTTVTLTAQITGTMQSSFQWSTGSTSSSIVADTTNTYTVTATNSCGSSTASQSVIEIPNTPVTITTSGNITFCNGDSVTLFANGGAPYTWSTGAATNSIVVYSSSVITVIGNPVCGSSTAQQIITVIDPPVAAINGNTVICPGKEVQLTASGGDTYQWSSGETTAEIMVTLEGDYIVTATNLCGSDTQGVHLFQSTLSVSFFADTLSGAAPLPVSFTSSITNSNAYQWNFGDGSTSNGINPTHIFSSGGLYTVVLSVEDQNGCTATYSEEINVTDETGIFIPSAFTPDGDGLNDLFIIKGAGITNISTTIFNRWGQAINVFDKINEGWNGQDANNQPEPEGIYGYFARISLTNGDTKKVRGSVLLLR